MLIALFMIHVVILGVLFYCVMLVELFMIHVVMLGELLYCAMLVELLSYWEKFYCYVGSTVHDPCCHTGSTVLLCDVGRTVHDSYCVMLVELIPAHSVMLALFLTIPTFVHVAPGDGTGKGKYAQNAQNNRRK